MILNICFPAEERRRMLHEIEYRDAEVARQVQTRLFKDTGTPPLPMMSNGDVPEAVGGKVFLVLWLFKWWKRSRIHFLILFFTKLVFYDFCLVDLIMLI